MSFSIYVDTSALAKWYLNEPRSEHFEAFVIRHRSIAISRLTVVEFRCLLARRRRAGDISARMEKRVFAVFEGDIRHGAIVVHALEDRHAVAAVELLSSLARHPLRTLDALHLAVARDLGASLIATADRVMAAAADALGVEVSRFD